jgi:hypothetical protein
VVEKVADSEDDRGGENCMPIRIRLDITTPLCRGHNFKFDGSKIGWVSFRYERLPNFCYWCRCLDHSDRDCEVGLRNVGVEPPMTQQYGAWLRASMDRSPRQTIITVAGSQGKSREKPPPGSPKRQESAPSATPNHPESTPNHVPYFTRLNMETPIEVEQYMDLTDPVSESNPKSVTFEEELQAIDNAINYIPGENVVKGTSSATVTHVIYNPGPISGAEISTLNIKAPDHSFRSTSTRATLNDISNGPSRPNMLSKPSATKWKKRATTQVSTTPSPPPFHSLKRDISYLSPETGPT